MKKLTYLLLITLFLSFNAQAGTLRGSWEMVNNESSSTERAVMIATENYLSIAVFEKNTYIRTYGGVYEFSKKGDEVIVSLEFNDKHPETIGTKVTYKFKRKGNSFTLENQAKTTWKRIDEGKKNLSGAWLIWGFVEPDGKITERKRTARKTIKMMSDSRFQWIAINPETKESFGTGGGTYTLIDGKYTETIEFFSRDNSRVGATLSFDAKVEGNKWYHSGKSSKGDRIHEIWAKE